MTRESSVESAMRMVAEVAVWLCEGRRKAKGLRRGDAMAGLGSSFAGTGGWVDFIGRAYADGVAGVVHL